MLSFGSAPAAILSGAVVLLTGTQLAEGLGLLLVSIYWLTLETSHRLGKLCDVSR